MRNKLLEEQGTVTAELAISLPAVFLVLLVTLSAFSLQIERMKLVDVAATAARALARGEEQAAVLQLVSQLAPNTLEADIDVSVQEDFLCVDLKRSLMLPGLDARLFDLAERQCARKVGL